MPGKYCRFNPPQFDFQVIEENVGFRPAASVMVTGATIIQWSMSFNVTPTADGPPLK